MTYPLDPQRPERYAKLVTLYIQLPDGSTVTRKTDHTYKFATAVYTPDRDDGRPATWGVLGWHHNRKNAENRMQQFRNAVSQRYPDFQWAIITVLEDEPEPLEDTSRLGQIVQNFMNAAPVEVVRPSLQYPEPVPGKTFKTVPKGSTTVHVLIYVDGVLKTGFYHTKELLARKSVKRFMGLGYALIEDGAGIVSPKSSYRG